MEFKKIGSRMLAAAMGVMMLSGVAMAAEPAEGVQILKFDRTANVSKTPAEFRTAATMFKRVKGDIYPTREGLDSLRMSGSSFCAENEWKYVLKNIPAEPSQIVVLDLRNESHGYINGHGVSWYSKYKTFNKGLDAKTVMERETKLLNDAKAAGTVDIAVQAKDKGIVYTAPIAVKSVKTEKEVVESLGMNYYRIPIMDYYPPSRANIDQFVEFYKKLPKDAWIHTHCEAGVGRTTITLSMIDMINNATKVSYDDIMTRQVLMGGQDVRKSTSSDAYKAANYPKRAEFTKQFYDYAKAHPTLDITWSQWCQQQGYPEWK